MISQHQHVAGGCTVRASSPHATLHSKKSTCSKWVKIGLSLAITPAFLLRDSCIYICTTPETKNMRPRLHIASLTRLASLHRWAAWEFDPVLSLQRDKFSADSDLGGAPVSAEPRGQMTPQREKSDESERACCAGAVGFQVTIL